ncbi:MAG TPA: DUF5074 domain-containing protein [Chitinophagales bacterium]|nr:DUF5074 domain-containing protein [Chitinophagales bacterium]
MRKYLCYIMLLFIASCDKEKTPDLPTGAGVYVVNEGLFNFGNAEVSFYNPTSNEETHNLFDAANGYSLGDVGQSMFIKDSIGFIVVNNSAKVEVVKMPSLKRISTISIPGSSPRNFLPVNDSIAYVSELYAKKIWVVNYLNGTVVNSIATQGWIEDMVQIGDAVFAAQKINTLLTGTFAAVYKINVNSHTAAQHTTFEGRDVNGIVKDKLNRIWVAVDEDTASGKYAGFYCLDNNLSMVKSFFYSSYGHHPSRLCVNGEGDRLFFVERNVYSMYVSETEVPVVSLVSGLDKNIYAMGINPVNADIYISDALDFVQQSKIYRYDKFGNPIHSFTAGVISGNFAFYE